MSLPENGRAATGLGKLRVNLRVIEGESPWSQKAVTLARRFLQGQKEVY
jgi:hypothetical protein